MKYLLLICLCISSSCYSIESQEKNFDKYMEGALEIYSQFKSPSKEESEKFYDFVKSKWIKSECKNDCSLSGQASALEYVEKNNIAKKPIIKLK